MKRLQNLALLLAMTCSVPAWSQAAAPAGSDSIVLRAGDFNLTQADYEKLVLGYERASGAPTTGPSPQSKQTGQEVASLLALVSEAQRRKIDQDPKTAALIRVRGYVLLANALLASLTAEAKKDEAGTRALYESEKNTYIEITARQILIRHQGSATDKPGVATSKRSESQAKAEAAALYAKVKAGAKFSELAKKSSEDETTKAKGGELPPFSRGVMQAEFEAAAFSLPVGGVSEPVKTKYGYHLIEIVERRPFPFERVKPTLEFLRAKQKLEEISKSGIQLSDAYFKP